MFALAFIASSLATFALASPLERQTSLCPWNGVPDASNFTLLAVFKSDNNMRKPLAIGSNVMSFSFGYAWLGSVESMDSESIISKNFTMVHGGITAYGSGSNIVGVSRTVPQENGFLPFLLPKHGVAAVPAEVYCELFSTSAHGQEFPFGLGVNGGDSDHFSLCQRSDNDQFVVVYGAVKSSPETAGYKWETCTDVYIDVIPVGR